MFIFFIFFESTLIPMFLLINIWGSRTRKIYASYLLFSFTLVGSLFILLAIFFIYLTKGSTNFLFIQHCDFINDKHLFLFLFLFLGFSVKIPMIPFHI